jgi:O-antigen ligase
VWLLLTMIGIMPFEQNPHLLISDSFMGLPGFTLIKLLGLIGFAWALSEIAAGHPIAFFETRQARLFAVFVVAMLLPAALNGFAVMLFSRVLSIVCLMPIIFVAVRDERKLVHVLKAAVLIMIAIFPYAYRQQLRFGGRFGVGLYDCNYLALLLVLVLPLAPVFARSGETHARRALWAAGGIAIVVQIVLTGSRGGFVALCAAAIAMCAAERQHRVKLVAVAVSLIAGILLLVPNPMLTRLKASGLDDDVQDSGVEQSNESRLGAIEAGLNMIADRPLTGVGLGFFKASVEEYGEVQAQIAHNTYIELAAELGIPALLAFVALLMATLSSLRRSERLMRSDGDVRLASVATAMWAGLIGYAVGATFLSAQYEKFFWVMVFASMCLERMARERSLGGTNEPAERPQQVLA